MQKKVGRIYVKVYIITSKYNCTFDAIFTDTVSSILSDLINEFSGCSWKSKTRITVCG